MSKSARLVRLAVVAAIGCAAWAEPATGSAGCGPAYENLLDRHGAPLPTATPFIAWVEQDSKTAVVFRKNKGDIAALVARLRAEGTAEEQMLKASYWQAARCQKVQERCEGTCPVVAGKQQSCLPQLEAVKKKTPPKPPKKPVMKPPKLPPKGKKEPPHPPVHTKDGGKAGLTAPTSILRCFCR